MGYSICGTHGSRTCDRCDECPKCEREGKAQFRMRIDRCPAGWCGETRLCPACKAITPLNHIRCAAYSRDFKEQLQREAEATAAGLPVIKAGVGLPSGRVFAWTTIGNFEVATHTYRAGLEHPAKVLEIEGAMRRTEERPPEVYRGRRGA